MSTPDKDAPSLPEKRAGGTSLAPHITATAIQPWQSAELDRRLGATPPFEARTLPAHG
jgi:hypothetical protein